MMAKICTSIEQSKKIIELGIDVSTADMFWRSLNLNGHISWSFHIKRLEPPIYDDKYYIPAWSLSALLELMPKDKERIFDVTFGYYDNDDNYIKEWCCSYLDNTTNEELPLAEAFHGNNSLDAAFEMIVWLKKNRKI